MQIRKKIIYDFGANNGDDIPYYLKKSDLVVAVEANPILAQQIRERFSSEIECDRLRVEASVLTVREEQNNSPFYIHKSNHVLSQFVRPSYDSISEFEQIFLPSKNVIKLIAEHGEPFYIKIDVEHYDAEILSELFSNGIKPPYISAESHSVLIFSLLVAAGRYNSFNLIDGSSVCIEYKNHTITSSTGNKEIYSFPYHSAGPFGEDIRGPWMTADNFFRYLASVGLGWKDIHATTEIEPMEIKPTSDPVVAKPRKWWRSK
jgi:FkbM family methyltransferase